MLRRWTRRIGTAVIVLAAGLLLVGVVAVAVFVYAYAHQFDGDKAAMQALLTRNLRQGASLTTVKRFLHTPAFATFQHAHHFDVVYVDARPLPVATYVYNSGPIDQSVSPFNSVLGVELDRYADDVKMSLTLLFDRRDHYVRCIIDEWGPTM
jgi:hypothetical protein